MKDHPAEDRIFSLSRELFSLTRERGLKIAFAESLTGGRLCCALVEHPGVSACFLGGIVAYSNQAKVSLLGVREETLELYGAVSRETAEEMVKGLAARFPADVMAAVTGIAGPGGGSEEKPAGTVHGGFLVKGRLSSRAWHFPGGREEVIRACLLAVYGELLSLLTPVPKAPKARDPRAADV